MKERRGAEENNQGRQVQYCEEEGREWGPVRPYRVTIGVVWKYLLLTFVVISVLVVGKQEGDFTDIVRKGHSW